MPENNNKDKNTQRVLYGTDKEKYLVLGDAITGHIVNSMWGVWLQRLETLGMTTFYINFFS